MLSFGLSTGFRSNVLLRMFFCTSCRVRTFGWVEVLYRLRHETHATNGAYSVFAFPVASVRETTACRWNAVSFSSKFFPKNFRLPFSCSRSSSLLCFVSVFKPTYRSYDPQKFIGAGVGNRLAEAFFFFPFLENFP